MRSASEEHDRSIALMKFLSTTAKRLGVAEHTYVVGGAVRNFLIDKPIKDIDVVFDSLGAGKNKDSEWFARRLQRVIPPATNLTTNQYGVAILTIKGPWNLDGHDLQGEVIEIANARKESYGGESGKGYKPSEVEPATIEEDLSRREFTFNTLLWRLSDLERGPDRAEVLDLLGTGRKHLDERILSTPVDPNKTFSDDPTRMLRAIKFVAKYKFKIPPDMVSSIRRNANKLKQMPWDAIRKILIDDILEGPAPRESVRLMDKLGLGETLKEMLGDNPGFATALNRSLGDREAHLILDLLDLGWTLKTNLSFLDRKGQRRLREILLHHADDPAFEKDFIAALKKPPINQVEMFEKFDIPPRERSVVTTLARETLMAEPILVERTYHWEATIERALQQRYKQASLSKRVANRWQRQRGG